MEKIRNLYGPSLKAEGQIKYLIIFLHGWGSNGDDLIQLANYWKNDLKNALFLSPNAPEVCTANEQGRQWFDIMSDNKEIIYKGLEKAYLDLQTYIKEQLNSFNLDNKKYFLVGFSQGTMLALHSALRKKCLGVLGYSGGIIDYKTPKKFENNNILLLHGKQDTIVPISRMHHAKSLLKSFSIEAKTREYDNLEHSINEQGLKDGLDFLKSNI